jgi:hypothetical protein
LNPWTAASNKSADAFFRHCEPPGRREAPPDDKLREAIHRAAKRKNGLLRRCAPRNDDRTNHRGLMRRPILMLSLLAAALWSAPAFAQSNAQLGQVALDGEGANSPFLCGTVAPYRHARARGAADADAGTRRSRRDDEEQASAVVELVAAGRGLSGGEVRLGFPVIASEAKQVRNLPRQLVFRPGNSLTKSREFLENGVSSSGPDEGL